MADAEAEEEAPQDQQLGEEKEEEMDETLEGEDEGEESEGGEEEEQESEEGLFELLNESESDDEQEQAMYKEYLEVIKEIDAQNLVIQNLKAMATELRCKKCQTHKDREEYKRLRICQEQQDIHLRQLINRAAQLQNFGSRRLYEELEMELTDNEENSFLTGLASTSLAGEEKCCNRGCPCCRWESDSSSDSENFDPACWTDF
ncbi:hypothetical protein KR032_010330 [Drosophila birchii]|nr:hypothetical protein KR032_010330 [Drosophila birchii]